MTKPRQLRLPTPYLVETRKTGIGWSARVLGHPGLWAAAKRDAKSAVLRLALKVKHGKLSMDCPHPEEIAAITIRPVNQSQWAVWPDPSTNL